MENRWYLGAILSVWKLHFDLPSTQNENMHHSPENFQRLILFIHYQVEYYNNQLTLGGLRKNICSRQFPFPSQKFTCVTKCTFTVSWCCTILWKLWHLKNASFRPSAVHNHSSPLNFELLPTFPVSSHSSLVTSSA